MELKYQNPKLTNKFDVKSDKIVALQNKINRQRGEHILTERQVSQFVVDYAQKNKLSFVEAVTKLSYAVSQYILKGDDPCLKNIEMLF